MVPRYAAEGGGPPAIAARDSQSRRRLKIKLLRFEMEQQDELLLLLKWSSIRPMVPFSLMILY